jgi:ribosomal protein S18 acetylase RimI-like enzyme
MIIIRQASTDSDLDHARRLIGLFITWLKKLYPDNTQGVDAYFASIQPELASLPGQYALPSGRLLLAICGDKVAGMVAMRDLGSGTSEMKRMFVDTAFQGTGVGRALATTLLSQARDAGYSRMRLDTSHQQVAAFGLYKSLGFKEIQPYYEAPEEVRANLTFMEIALQSQLSANRQ